MTACMHTRSGSDNYDPTATRLTPTPGCILLLGKLHCGKILCLRINKMCGFYLGSTLEMKLLRDRGCWTPSSPPTLSFPALVSLFQLYSEWPSLRSQFQLPLGICREDSRTGQWFPQGLTRQLCPAELSLRRLAFLVYKMVILVSSSWH